MTTRIDVPASAVSDLIDLLADHCLTEPMLERFRDHPTTVPPLARLMRGLFSARVIYDTLSDDELAEQTLGLDLPDGIDVRTWDRSDVAGTLPDDWWGWQEPTAGTRLCVGHITTPEGEQIGWAFPVANEEGVS